MSGGKVFVRRRGTTALPNSTVYDDRLSYAALGLLAVLLARPDGLPGGYRDLQGRGLGQKATLTALAELTAAGYRHQVRRRGEGGRWLTDTVVSEEPISSAQAHEWLSGEPVDNPGDRAEDSAARSDLRKHRKPAGGAVRRSAVPRSAVPRSTAASLRAKGSSLRSEPQETNAAENVVHIVTECEHGEPRGSRACALCRTAAQAARY